MAAGRQKDEGYKRIKVIKGGEFGTIYRLGLPDVPARKHEAVS
jgi:hypothetical protein